MGSPDLADVIADFVAAGLATLQAAIPAVVVTYDPLTQRAVCKPVNRRLEPNLVTGEIGPSLFPSPATPPLPVAWPSGAAGAWAITGPLLPGDPVTLVIRSRSCDEWQTTGAPDVTPLDPRQWAIQDAIVVPGARPLPLALLPAAVDPLSMVLFGTPASPVKLGSALATDPAVKGAAMVAALDALLTAIQVATTTVGTAVQNAAALTAIGVAATTAKSALLGTLSTTVRVAP